MLKLILVLLMLSEATAKLVLCHNKFGKKLSHDYCTKFGTAQHTMMDV